MSGNGSRVEAPFGRRLCRVTINEPSGSYRLVGAEDPSGPGPLPGQFYMLMGEEHWGGAGGERPYLARAFSVCRTRDGRLDFLVDDIGPGTHTLASLSPGQGLWVVGPLGNGFSPPASLLPQAGSPRALMVGGGIGVAPLVGWGEALARAAVRVRNLLGYRSAAHSRSAELFSGEVVLATDDGSLGHHGLVTDLLEAEPEDPEETVVYACGPPAMLEQTRAILARRSVPCELALEEAMACGFGACVGCVVPTTTGYRRICVDGPVVPAADLDEAWLERSTA